MACWDSSIERVVSSGFRGMDTSCRPVGRSEHNTNRGAAKVHDALYMPLSHGSSHGSSVIDMIYVNITMVADVDSGLVAQYQP